MDHTGGVFLALAIILIAAKIGGELFVCLKQPAVLGELIVGLVLGNIGVLGFHGLDFLKSDTIIATLSEIGVVLLLFDVGLESDMGKMMKQGLSSLLVATLGVIVPFLLGWFVSTIFMPGESVYVHAFIGAALCATSVGITARVLSDLGRLQSREARIILGAAVIDDVQGLIILAVVAGLVSAADSGLTLSATSIAMLILRVLVFFGVVLILGRKVAKLLLELALRLKTRGALLIFALVICFALSAAASLVKLSPIVGAFAAGLILEEQHWRRKSDRGEQSVRDLIAPLVAFLAPIFFVRMGLQVSVAAFAQPGMLLFALCLTFAAVIGKQVCGLGALGRGLDRITIGIGMIPRGEVGLIFAAIGSGLYLGGERVINPHTYAAIVVMVLITTLLSPLLLKWSIGRHQSKEIQNG